jgi:hypothetical protein
MARRVSNEFEPLITMSSTDFNEPNERISMWLDCYHNDYDADELMSSPLILPEE